VGTSGVGAPHFTLPWLRPHQPTHQGTEPLSFVLELVRRLILLFLIGRGRCKRHNTGSPRCKCLQRRRQHVTSYMYLKSGTSRITRTTSPQSGHVIVLMDTEHIARRVAAVEGSTFSARGEGSVPTCGVSAAGTDPNGLRRRKEGHAASSRREFCTGKVRHAGLDDGCAWNQTKCSEDATTRPVKNSGKGIKIAATAGGKLACGSRGCESFVCVRAP